MKRAASDTTVINQWRFHGRGPGGGGRPPPLSLDQTEVRKAEKKFLGDPSPSPYLKVWIYHCKRGNWETKFHDLYKVACVASVSVQFHLGSACWPFRGMLRMLFIKLRTPNRHPRKRTGLLTATETKSRFSPLPYKLCIFTFP